MQKKNKINYLKIIALFLLVLGGVIFFNKYQPIMIKNNLIFVETAKTVNDRAKGLQHRKSIPRNSGMLFIFAQEQYPQFWMKNTQIPLAIAFIDKNKVILDIQQMIPLREDLRYKTRRASKYVLEMNAGWFKDHNINPGDRLSF